MYINATLTLVQTVFSIFALFFSYRLVIAHVGIEQLGLWALLVSIVALTRIAELGLSGSLLKYVSSFIAKKQLKEARLAIDSATISIAVLVGFVMLLSYYPIIHLVNYILNDTQLAVNARDILFLSFSCAWLAAISGVTKLALEGTQRYDLSTTATILGTLVFVFSIIILVPKYNLHGLAYSIILQNTVLFLLYRFLFRYTETKLNLIPIYFSLSLWKEILLYGLNYQAISILKLLLEPLTKGIMGKMGSVELIGYFDLASKFVTQMRRILVTMNQVIIPRVSETQAIGSLDLPRVYRKNYELVNFLCIYFFGALAVAVPLLETLWFGSRVPVFETLSLVAILAFFLNTLSIPAYMVNLGIGDMKENLRSHIIMGLVNIILGLVLGYFFGGLGVVFAWAIALIAGTLPIILPFHRKHKIPLISLVKKEDIIGVSLCVLGIFVGWAAFNYFGLYYNLLHAFVFTLLSTIVLIFVPMWFHPTRAIAVERIILVGSNLLSRFKK